MSTTRLATASQDDLPGVPLQPTRRGDGRRLLGSLLVAYGLMGLGILVGGAMLINGPLDQLSQTTGSLEEQRTLLVRSLRSTSQTFGDAADGMTGFDESLVQARQSTARAAVLARDVSGTMSELARAMSISIFGTQPLISLAASFERAGQQLNTLGDDIEAMGTALERNAADGRVTRRNLEGLQDEVEDLAVSVEETELPKVPTDAISAVRIALLLLVGWLSMLALGSLALGLFLWLPPRRPPLAP